MAFGSSRRVLYFIIGIVFVAVIGVVLFLSFRHNWEPALSGVDAASLGVIESVLQDEGIRTRLDAQNGVIYVPSQDVDRAWLIVQTSTLLNETAFSFERAIEASVGGITRDGVDYGMILRAREREIEGALMAVDEIVDAEVQIIAHVIQPEARASVTIFGDVTAQMGQMAAMIVSRSVAGLDIENVEVFAEDGTRLFPEYFPYIVEDMIEAVREIVMPNDFPGGPLFGEIPEHIFEMFDNDTVRRFLYDTVQDFDFEGVNISDFPGSPLFGEIPEHILEMFDNSDTRRFLYDIIVNFVRP